MENVKLMQKLELNIIDSGINGEGIAKWQGITVFVPATLIGETVLAQVVEIKGSFLRAKVIKIITASSDRVVPFCPVYFQCGGCQLQHVSYDYQLKLKRNAVSNTLFKQLKTSVNVAQVVPSTPFYYRNKAQLPVGMGANGVVVGFYKPNTHKIVPITSCPLHYKWLDLVVQAFLEYANKFKVSVYNESGKNGVLRHLVVRNVANYLTITVVGNANKLPYDKEMVTILSNKLKEYEWSLFFSKNAENTNVIMQNNLQLISGIDKKEVTVMGLIVTVNPLSFFQVNSLVSERIYADIVAQVQGENNVVIDAYSGAGLLTALISKSVKFAYGIEIIKEAVNDANDLAKNNNLKNVANVCGDVVIQLPKLLDAITLPKNNLIIVLDPPRKGCEENVLNTVLSVSPKKIVYLSCNPATLARDLTLLLKEEKYEISSVVPYDMFPQTHHVETLVVLNRRD